MKMNNEELFIPKIRGKEFNGTYNNITFNKLYEFAAEGGTPDTNNKKYYENGNIPFIKIEDTTKKYITDSFSKITELGLNKSSAWIIPKDSVIFTNGATVGNVSINKIPVSTKQGILGIIPKQEITSEYMYYLLSGNDFQKNVKSRIARGTFATISLKNMDEINVRIPKEKEEQYFVASFLSHIDELIDNSQKIIEKKEKIKSSLLSKVFPKKDDLYPEIRFKSFSECSFK